MHFDPELMLKVEKQWSKAASEGLVEEQSGWLERMWYEMYGQRID